MLGSSLGDRIVALAGDGEARALRALPVTRAGAPRVAPASVLAELLGEQGGQQLWVAVGSRASPLALGELLREARAAGADVQGFIDAGVATAAWLGAPVQSILIELGQDQCTFSHVGCDGQEARLRRTAVVETGAASLLERWLSLFAESMVRQTRYDPLHDLRREAQLRERVRAAAIQAEQEGSARIDFDAEGRVYELTLSRDQFTGAVADSWQPVAAMLQALCAGVGDCQILAPASLLQLPGAGATLAVAGSRPVWRIPDEFAAQAASLLAPAVHAEHGAVRHLTQLPVFASPAPEGLVERAEVRGAADAEAATHFVFRGRAVAIGEEGIVLGREPGEGAALQLPEGIAGLSRRHCTLRRAGAETVLVDHSRYGTFVDGQRVNGRTLLQAGSLLRLGTPGVELPLIAIGQVA